MALLLRAQQFVTLKFSAIWSWLTGPIGNKKKPPHRVAFSWVVINRLFRLQMPALR
jgi:hypothetical protein